MDPSPLLSPLALAHGVTSPSRLWLAPLTNLQSHSDGSLSDEELHFLAMRADGGFGLVSTCAAYVSQDGKAWPGELGLHEDAMLPGLTRLAARIHTGGALAGAQLFHGGLRADSAVSGLSTWSASAAEGAREGTEEDIYTVIAAFAAAATRCAAAGFDAVELHGAHGYLLSQFLSTVYNCRTDGYGGSLDNRMRLILEVLRAVRAAAPNIVIVVRLSPEDFGQAKGLDLDETLEVAKRLADNGMDVLHLSLWRAHLHTVKRPEAHPTMLFRKAVGEQVPIVVAGQIWTREEAEAQLALGANAVAVGRAAIVNHDWPRRIHTAPDSIVRPPVTEAHLRAEGLSPRFASYMRNWKNFVTE